MYDAFFLENESSHSPPEADLMELVLENIARWRLEEASSKTHLVGLVCKDWRFEGF